MYKVFFNDRSLILSDNKEFFNNSDNQIISYQGDSKLIPMVVKEFENETCGNKVLIYHNLEQLWQDFKQHFRYIHAGGGVVKNEQGNLLFIYRLNRWDLPKGKAEQGESIDQTALREIEEECGLSYLKIEQKLPSTYHTYLLKGKHVLKETHWFMINYRGNEQLIPQTEEDISKVRWVPPQDIAQIVQNTYASIKELLSLLNLG